MLYYVVFKYLDIVEKVANKQRVLLTAMYKCIFVIIMNEMNYSTTVIEAIACILKNVLSFFLGFEKYDVFTD